MGLPEKSEDVEWDELGQRFWRLDPRWFQRVKEELARLVEAEETRNEVRRRIADRMISELKRGE